MDEKASPQILEDSNDEDQRLIDSLLGKEESGMMLQNNEEKS